MERGPKSSSVPVICWYSHQNLAQEGSTELHFLLDGVDGVKNAQGTKTTGSMCSAACCCSIPGAQPGPPARDTTFPFIISIPLSSLSSQATSEAARKPYEHLHGRAVPKFTPEAPRCGTAFLRALCSPCSIPPQASGTDTCQGLCLADVAALCWESSRKRAKAFWLNTTSYFF